MKHSFRNILLVLTACALLILTGCTSAVQRDYETGESLIEQGKYGEASEIFQALGSYEDASRLLMYCRAALALENGNYAAAKKTFSVLGGFRDSAAMLRYTEGRESEAAGRQAIEAGDSGEATRRLIDAAELYTALPAFRDAEQRGADCLGTLYDQGLSFLKSGEYASARDLFGSLGDMGNSAGMKIYAEACLLEAEGAWLDAADRFSAVPSVLDAAERADRDRSVVYQQALELSAKGEHEDAIALFALLGSYQDSEARLQDTLRMHIQDRLQRGDYEGALLLMDSAGDAASLLPADSADRQRFGDFLDRFVSAYLHFSSGTMDAWSGYYGVLPYIEQGGALDARFRQVTMIGSYSHNSNFIYYGSDLLDLFLVDESCYLAYVRASASVLQPIGQVDVTRTFRILLRDTGNGPIVGSIEDCLYGEPNSSGRMVLSGPLPNLELPPDEDGDGIILADVMKKGFNGTMIIVLDPSRVFAGYPGFYGGNGMLLEDLVRRYDAVGGINGGGFIDDDGGGSGGFPAGLTIVGGEAYLWAGSGASAAFDENNVLHVGDYNIETAAAAHIRDCVSFGPALIVDGVPQYGPSMESGINPRTAIGQRADGAVLMLCIDGRQLHSIGASFGDLRDVMLDFGAVNACSLDGGSSTVMYCYGEYLNRPSSASGTSRYLPNAFLIRK